MNDNTDTLKVTSLDTATVVANRSGTSPWDSKNLVEWIEKQPISKKGLSSKGKTGFLRIKLPTKKKLQQLITEGKVNIEHFKAVCPKCSNLLGMVILLKSSSKCSLHKKRGSNWLIRLDEIPTYSFKRKYGKNRVFTKLKIPNQLFRERVVRAVSNDPLQIQQPTGQNLLPGLGFMLPPPPVTYLQPPRQQQLPVGLDDFPFVMEEPIEDEGFDDISEFNVNDDFGDIEEFY